MTPFYVISPEVPGQLRSDCELVRGPKGVRALSARAEFDGWLGDELVTIHPLFLVTDRVASALARSALQGFEIDDAEVGRSEIFEELYSGRGLPTFRWLRVTGAAFRDDFGVCRGRLIVSQRALAVLRDFRIAQAEIAVAATP